MPPTHPFRLFHLPYVVQRTIIPQIEFTSLFVLSTLSKKFKLLLKQINPPTKIFKFFISPDYTGIFLTINSKQYFIGLLTGTDRALNCKVDGCRMRYRIQMDDDDPIGRVFLFSARGKMLERVAKHLLSFMKVQKFQIVISKEIDLKKLFIWNITKSFEKFTYTPFDGTLYINLNQLKFVLEEIETEYLTLNVILNDGIYQCDPRFTYKHRKICFLSSELLVFNRILEMEVPELKIWLAEEPGQRANLLLKQWIGGNNQTLEILTLDSDFVGTIRQVFSDINDADLPEYDLKEFTHDLHGDYVTHEIQRESDGLHATAMFANRWLRLIVWNQNNLGKVEQVQ